MILHSSEQENLARPGAGKDIRVAVVINVHNMWTESDTSAAWDASVLFAFLEFHSCGQLRLRIRALVAIYPQQSVFELADQQIFEAVSVEIKYKRCGMAYFSFSVLCSRRSGVSKLYCT